MLALDADALVCDFAQVYHIYDFRALPLLTVATLACGLDERSRIFRAKYGLKSSPDTLLLAGVCDRLSAVLACLTGKKPGAMLTDLLSGRSSDDSDAVVFDSPEDFWAAHAAFF